MTMHRTDSNCLIANRYAVPGDTAATRRTSAPVGQFIHLRQQRIQPVRSADDAREAVQPVPIPGSVVALSGLYRVVAEQ